MPEKLLTVSQVADTLSVSRNHIYKLIKHKNFPKPIHIGSASRWKSSAVQDWIDQQK